MEQQSKAVERRGHAHKGSLQRRGHAHKDSLLKAASVCQGTLYESAQPHIQLATFI